MRTVSPRLRRVLEVAAERRHPWAPIWRGRTLPFTPCRWSDKPVVPIEPILTHEAHRAALAEIELVWDAEPGSPEEVRLDALVTAACDFEDRVWPINPPTERKEPA